MPHELFLAARQTTKTRNAFADMSTDVKVSQAQISKIISSGGSFGSWFGNLRKKALSNIAIPLARYNLPRSVSNLPSNAINKFEKKNKSKRTCDSRERIHFIYNERVKHEIKKQEDQFLGALLILLAASVVQPSELGDRKRTHE